MIFSGSWCAGRKKGSMQLFPEDQGAAVSCKRFLLRLLYGKNVASCSRSYARPHD